MKHTNYYLTLWLEQVDFDSLGQSFGTVGTSAFQPRVSMANLVLSAGLGAYVAVLEHQAMWLQYGERKRDIATRKAALRALRDCIVEAYLRDAEAAGWPKWQYQREDVFQQSIIAHCFPLPMMAYEQLTHAFVLRVRAGMIYNTCPQMLSRRRSIWSHNGRHSEQSMVL